MFQNQYRLNTELVAGPPPLPRMHWYSAFDRRLLLDSTEMPDPLSARLGLPVDFVAEAHDACSVSLADSLVASGQADHM